MLPFQVHRKNRGSRPRTVVRGAILNPVPGNPSDPPPTPTAIQVINAYQLDENAEQFLLVTDSPIIAPIGSTLALVANDDIRGQVLATIIQQNLPNAFTYENSYDPSIVLVMFPDGNYVRGTNGQPVEGLWVPNANTPTIRPYMFTASVQYGANTGEIEFREVSGSEVIDIHTTPALLGRVSNVAGDKTKPIISAIRTSFGVLSIQLGAETNPDGAIDPQIIELAADSIASTQWNVPNTAGTLGWGA